MNAAEIEIIADRATILPLLALCSQTEVHA